MNSIAIITIVVVALLTLIIFGLAWLGYSSCLKIYKLEVEQGKHDDNINKSKKKHKGGLVGNICSYLTLLALLGLFITGVIYKANGDNFSINNQTALVIKSGSMSDFYDDGIAEQYNNDKSLQFDVGDICVFEKIDENTELVKGEVYGYKYKDIIITHRLVNIQDTVCEFRGDNNSASDGLVLRYNVVYHYTGNKVVGIGTFVLYAQSYFGIWSVVSMLGILISSEIVYFKIRQINKSRIKKPDVEVLPPKPKLIEIKKDKKHEK